MPHDVSPEHFTRFSRFNQTIRVNLRRRVKSFIITSAMLNFSHLVLDGVYQTGEVEGEFLKIAKRKNVTRRNPPPGRPITCIVPQALCRVSLAKSPPANAPGLIYRDALQTGTVVYSLAA